MARLTITSGSAQGITFEFGEDVTIGRSQEASMVLPDKCASRKHSAVRVVGSNYFLEDLKSHNGTYLNGNRIEKQEKLKNNDTIRIGGTNLVFVGKEPIVESVEEGKGFYGYKIQRQIYQNETGKFYLATQSALERDVLLWVFSAKNLVAGKELTKENQEDFLHQIRQVAGLIHRNLVMLLDFATTKNFIYCAFECVDLDTTIKKYIDENPQLSIDESLEIAEQAAEALCYAHSQEIFHLHLTSKNIVIQTGHYKRVLLTEFGISRFLSTAGGSSTMTGILSISDYIAPEQIKEEALSAQTDVFAFGCFLYHLLTKESPFKVSVAKLKGNLHDKYTPLDKKRTDIPANLSLLVDKCLQKDPGSRGSMEEVLKSLRGLQKQITIEEALDSSEGQDLVKEHLGERTLLRWWFAMPFISSLLLVITFFALQLIR